MICCSQPRLELKKIYLKLQQSARLMIGQGDYDAYVAHCLQKHGEVTPLTRTQYYRACEEARFGVGGKRAFRCC
jgi:uncharacterized short protein YbdD (DUF466 family)